jgi:hypothetical protein
MDAMDTTDDTNNHHGNENEHPGCPGRLSPIEGESDNVRSGQDRLSPLEEKSDNIREGQDRLSPLGGDSDSMGAQEGLGSWDSDNTLRHEVISPRKSIPGVGHIPRDCRAICGHSTRENKPENRLISRESGAVVGNVRVNNNNRPVLHVAPPTITTNFSIDEILKPDFGVKTLSVNCSGEFSAFTPVKSQSRGGRDHSYSPPMPRGGGDHQSYSPPLSPASSTTSEGSSRTGSTTPGTTSGTSKSGSPGGDGRPPILWPAWVYCTRYSDRPSSGNYYRL